MRAADSGLEPNRAKRALARGIVERFHGAAAAARLPRSTSIASSCATRRPRRSRRRRLEDSGEVHLPALLAEHFGISRSEGRRLIAQGGVKIDGETAAAERLEIPASELDGKVVQLGKRRYKRFRVA